MSEEREKSILIVEDDLDYRNPLRDFLTARGYEVHTADDGEQAMDRLLVHKPGVVILDLLLPKIHGFEVLKKIRTYPESSVAKTPVIVLSNLSSPDDIKKGNEIGINAYFVKSHTSYEEVLFKIKEILFGGVDIKTREVWDFTQ